MRCAALTDAFSSASSAIPFITANERRLRVLDSGTAAPAAVLVLPSFLEWPFKSFPLASLTSFLSRRIDQSAITDSYDLSWRGGGVVWTECCEEGYDTTVRVV